MGERHARLERAGMAPGAQGRFQPAGMTVSSTAGNSRRCGRSALGTADRGGDYSGCERLGDP
ncbi:hypothetical protein Mal4_58500 [Maioricimonas rarisocia]|uniref:Uncharacterized protein n=1 Tax=Maioricimonas rarisocia TaxID=2528026 RepID=A0A517ZGB2_9PLAN|nr:hypothetical protein Mal4_58500 [Maioricimonas rarisocia]